MSPRTARGLLAGVLALVAAVGVSAPAAAHSKLVSSNPADGAVLASAPAEVSFTFDEDLLPGVDTIAITNADGKVLTSTKVEPDGNTITAPWPPGLPDGTYQVAYRIVSADGHPVSGAILITVSAEATSSPSEPSADSGSPQPSAAQVTQPTPTPTTTSGSGSNSPLLWVTVGIIVLLLGVVVGVVLWRRRRF